MKFSLISIYLLKLYKISKNNIPGRQDIYPGQVENIPCFHIALINLPLDFLYSCRINTLTSCWEESLYMLVELVLYCLNHSMSKNKVKVYYQ